MARIIVVGAGMAGLTAANDLEASGHDVTVLDKGRRPGGRMATRHLGDATFDHGAQFFTTKTDAFRDRVAAWLDDDVASTWFTGGPDRSSGDDGSDGHPRYRGTADMRSIPETMAASLDVRCAVTVTALRGGPDHTVEIVTEQDVLPADGLVLTAPAEQTIRLLDAGEVPLAGDLDLLRSITYDPCWAVLVRPDGTPDLPDHGALRLTDHPLHWISDNRRKGISDAPAVTIHASPERTRELFDIEATQVGRTLLADAADHLTGDVVRTHRWRYSAPRPADVPTALAVDLPAPIVVAGDVFAGGRVEGAFLSGRAAADKLTAMLT